MVGDLLHRALPVDTLVVAVDPGKAQNRVWLSTDLDGLVLEPLTLPVLRSGLDELTRLIQVHRGCRGSTRPPPYPPSPASRGRRCRPLPPLPSSALARAADKFFFAAPADELEQQVVQLRDHPGVVLTAHAAVPAARVMKAPDRVATTGIIKQLKTVACGFRNQAHCERRMMLHSAATMITGSRDGTSLKVEEPIYRPDRLDGDQPICCSCVSVTESIVERC